MTTSSIPPKPMGTARALDRGPSLRWRLRRWVLQRLDAWPRERPEPRTEWGRMRREERRRLVEEVERLRKLEGDRRVLMVALKPFARRACRPPCGECHHCAAEAAMQAVTEAP